MKKFLKIFVMGAIALVAFCSLVSCRNNAEGGSDDTVTKSLTSISVHQLYTGDYVTGDTITDDDIEVIACYSDGTTDTVTTWSYNTKDFSTAATNKDITISYTENGITKTDIITVTIVDAYTVNYTFTTDVTDLPPNTGGTAGTNATYVKFGDWPQTIKKSDVTIQERQKKEVGMFTYYAGSDGNWYAKCKENAYGTGSEYTYSDGTQVNKVSVNSYQYFKVEPIKWRVLTNNYNGKKLLFAESGLMANVPYYDVWDVNREINSKTVYPNNYEHSKIRAWLNGLSYVYKSSSTSNAETKDEYDGKGFLQTAFTAAEQAKIAQTVVDNSEASTNPASNANQWNGGTNQYACGNTTDKIFLLSMKEVTTGTYGFAEYDQYGAGNTRIRKPTDFALANYAWKSSNAAYGCWFFVRSPYFLSSSSARIGANGGYAYYDDGYSQDGVVVPALCVE